MSDPMKNPDRDEAHRRRRDTGDGDEDPDGRAVAAALYGGDVSELGDEDSDDSDEPNLFE